MEPDDLTLSDVHLNVTRSDIQPEVKEEQYTVCESRFAFTTVPSDDDGSDEGDSDDDDICVKRQDAKEVIYLRHTLETKLKDVGLQVWPGCVLLCDYLLSTCLQECIVLELGAGVGLASIVAARQAKMVLATDVGGSILSTCQYNMEQHDYMYKNKNSFVVKELDFFDEDLQSVDHEYGWSDDDQILLKEADTIIAADVIYDLDITDAFFKTVEKLTQNPPSKAVIIALERRLNFTLTSLDVSCPAYDHFQEHLQRLKEYDHSSKRTISVEQVETENIPQHFQGYTRSKYLELWKIDINFKD